MRIDWHEGDQMEVQWDEEENLERVSQEKKGEKG